MAGFKYLSRKKDISGKLIRSLDSWEEFETDNVEFSIIGDRGWILLYGNPVALINKATRNRVSSINLEVLESCSKSRFFMQERLNVSVMKDKKGLFLKTYSSESTLPEGLTETVIRLPNSVRWVFLGDLSRSLFYIRNENKMVVEGLQLSLHFTFTITGIEYTGSTNQAEISSGLLYPNSWSIGVSAASGTTIPTSYVSIGSAITSIVDSARDISGSPTLSDEYLRRYLREYRARTFNPEPVFNLDPISDGDIPY